MVTGIICSILLFKKADKKPSNKFLGLGILAFVWLNTKTLLLSLNLWEIHGIGFFPNGIELAIPPLFYFYFLSLIKPTFKFTAQKWLHFIPFLLSQSFAIAVYVAVMQTPLMSEKQLIASAWYFNEVKLLEEYLTFASTMVYLYMGYKQLRAHKLLERNEGSKPEFEELGFIKNLIRFFLFIAIYTIVNLILNLFLGPDFEWRWQLSHLMIASAVYYMGLVGYKNSDTIFGKRTSRRRKAATTGDMVDLEIIAKLENAIEKDKVHLNPQLSLQALAQSLEVTEATLSNTINAHYQKNFRAFINEARVEEVKQRLHKEGLDKLSLLGLAKECGFNSEASFYRIFKSVTGLTPKQFLASPVSASQF